MNLEQQPWQLSAQEVADLDKQFLWHPFTQMAEWCAPDFHPIALAGGKGATVWDADGNQYIDGNASIWTNIHGHCHPRINAAIKEQVDRISHTSFLGLTHPAAAVLARELVQRSPGNLSRVFYSDNGSTANEVALRMALQFRQIRNETRPRFVAFEHAYHGDTVGAANLSGIPLFNNPVQAPFPDTDHFSSMEELRARGPDYAATVNAAIIEPLVRGPAGVRPWPDGMLRELREWCTENDVLLILDEVMTGFGRTGTMFACEQENVVPDFLSLAKGITGGYLPLAATLTTDRIFETFLGDREKTFYYGHSYTANPVGCAAALASLQVFDEERVLEALPAKISTLTESLEALSGHPGVREIRQRGMVSAVEVCGHPLAETNRMGGAICDAAREFGLLTRPIGNAVVLLLPLCVTDEEIQKSVQAIEQALSHLKT